MSESSATFEPKVIEGGWLKLFSISFAILFFEVLLIRWIPCEIRIFGFFNNVILIAAVVGMGLGCATGGKTNTPEKKRVFWFPVLLSILAAILAAAEPAHLRHMSFQVVLDQFVWDSGVSTITSLFYNIIALTIIFLLVIASFDSLGRELGIEISKGTPNRAYTINLLGSLVGLVVYFSLCLFCAPPVVWLLVGALALYPIYQPKWMAAVMIVPMILAVVVAGNSIWSAYYRIDLEPRYLTDEKGQKVQDGTWLEVNHVFHQAPLNLSDEFVTAHPEVKKGSEYNTFNLPYAAVPHPKNVLILGGGTGNDIAAALRHGAEHVDAVEIDPSILKLGHQIHPEKPYDDPRVTAYNNDGRTILANTKKKYDLIVFGHVDSHTAFSALSSVRLDNFLYTRQSLEAAKDHLTDNGIASLSFGGGPPWLRARLYHLVKDVYGKQPVALNPQLFNPGEFIVLSGPGIDAIRSNLLEAEHKLIIPESTFAISIEPTTDDWPFLYQQSRTLPVVYILMLTFVILICSTIIVMRFRLRPAAFVGNSQFFFLGAGFLLLETRAMLAMSVLFGSTWIVNSVVIGIVLLMALIANILVQKVKAISEIHGYIGLMLCLIGMYLLPLGSLATQPDAIRYLASTLVIGLPFLCSGLVFSKAFARVSEPDKALGINILGALLGGCVEYASMITGVNALVLVAIVLYAISFACSKTRRSA